MKKYDNETAQLNLAAKDLPRFLISVALDREQIKIVKTVNEIDEVLSEFV